MKSDYPGSKDKMGIGNWVMMSGGKSFHASPKKVVIEALEKLSSSSTTTPSTSRLSTAAVATRSSSPSMATSSARVGSPSSIRARSQLQAQALNHGGLRSKCSKNSISGRSPPLVDRRRATSTAPVTSSSSGHERCSPSTTRKRIFGGVAEGWLTPNRNRKQMEVHSHRRNHDWRRSGPCLGLHRQDQRHILKPDSWSTPAKGPRGSIEPTKWKDVVGPYGVSYR